MAIALKIAESLLVSQSLYRVLSARFDDTPTLPLFLSLSHSLSSLTFTNDSLKCRDTCAPLSRFTETPRGRVRITETTRGYSSVIFSIRLRFNSVIFSLREKNNGNREMRGSASTSSPLGRLFLNHRLCESNEIIRQREELSSRVSHEKDLC